MAGETVLIVDDDADAREMMGTRLKAEGYHVIMAGSGKDGIDVAKLAKPNLIIVDVVMQGITGFGVGAYLKEEDSTKHIPIIMISGKRTDPRAQELAQKVGVVFFLEKPYDPGELLEKVRTALQGAPPADRASI